MPNFGSHDALLVALSVSIATLASYTALDLAARMRASSGRNRYAWLIAAAGAMGGGIWSMHFVAMLAFSMPGVEVSYDLTLTLISLILPVAVTALAFLVASRSEGGILKISASGLVMGIGIAAMHYTGMSAMRMSADLNYAPGWVTISLLIAFGAATAAIWLTSRSIGFVLQLAAAVTMGMAVAGMHYAAMQGVTFAAHASAEHAHQIASISQMYLAAWVAGITFLILLLALIAAMFDRRFAHRVELEAMAVRESEERFRLLLGSLSDTAIYMLDSQGRVANWNEGAERLKGYLENEIIGRHFSCFYTVEDKSLNLAGKALLAASANGRFENDGWRVRKDGSQFWASVVIHPVRDQAGTVIGFAKVTRDMTQRRLAQQELEQAREALFQSQKMEALGQLTGGVAHDFNNLLMVVLGSLELLRKWLPEDRKAERLLENAAAAAQRGRALTQRMLAFARRQELKLEAVVLPDLVHGMSDLLQRSIGSSLQIETRIPIGLPPALADAHQLELALLNLVVNARDAMPEGGAVTIAAFTGSAPSAKTNEVCLSVTDVGEGMDEETLARAQEPFFTTKGVGKGTGLGLSMVQGFAAQSNGRLVLKSKRGQGTTAEIWLPVAESSLKQETAHGDHLEVSPAVARSLTVLLVDDDPLVLENAAAMLEDLGHRVIEARSGEDALDRLCHVGKLDLVVTDYAMPNMTGVQLVGRIRQRLPGIRAVLATGYAEFSPEQAVDVIRLLKPFDQNSLSNAIQTAMTGSARSTMSAANP